MSLNRSVFEVLCFDVDLFEVCLEEEPPEEGCFGCREEEEVRLVSFPDEELDL